MVFLALVIPKWALYFQSGLTLNLRDDVMYLFKFRRKHILLSFEITSSIKVTIKAEAVQCI